MRTNILYTRIFHDLSLVFWSFIPFTNYTCRGVHKARPDSVFFWCDLYPNKHLDEIILFPYNSGDISMKGKTEMDSSSCDDCDTHNFIITIHGIPGPMTA